MLFLGGASVYFELTRRHLSGTIAQTALLELLERPGNQSFKAHRTPLPLRDQQSKTGSTGQEAAGSTSQSSPYIGWRCALRYRFIDTHRTHGASASTYRAGIRRSTITRTSRSGRWQQPKGCAFQRTRFRRLRCTGVSNAACYTECPTTIAGLH